MKVSQDQQDIIDRLRETNSKQEDQIAELKDKLDESEEHRRRLQQDINSLNEKIIVFEEELFESKTI